MNEEPNYYAILPATVRYDKGLKPMEKIMYSEITALSNKNGYCSATNSYFAKLYEVDRATVSRWIAHLQEKGYVDVVLTRTNKKEVKERKIYCSKDVLSIRKKEEKNPKNDKKINTPIDKKINTSIDLKVKKNNTRNNNINLTTTTRASAPASEPPTPKEVFDYYHEKKLDVSPERFWELNNKKKWKNGMAKNWRAAYDAMTPSLDEEHAPGLEFNPDKYGVVNKP